MKIPGTQIKFKLKRRYIIHTRYIQNTAITRDTVCFHMGRTHLCKRGLPLASTFALRGAKARQGSLKKLTYLERVHVDPVGSRQGVNTPGGVVFFSFNRCTRVSSLAGVRHLWPTPELHGTLVQHAHGVIDRLWRPDQSLLTLRRTSRYELRWMSCICEAVHF